MNINPISVRNTVSMKSGTAVQKNNTQTPEQTNTDTKNEELLKYSPAAIGAMTGISGGVIGFGFDKICSKLFKYESSNKTSLALNGIIGAGMGLYTYVQARKIHKEHAKTNV